MNASGVKSRGARSKALICTQWHLNNRFIDHLFLLLCPQLSSPLPSLDIKKNTQHQPLLDHLPRYHYLFIFSPHSWDFNFAQSVWSPPPFQRGCEVKKLARRCGPFSRLLCIASAWFPSSSCWHCRLRSVPTRTGRTRCSLCFSFKTRSWLLIGWIGSLKITDKRTWSRRSIQLYRATRHWTATKTCLVGA